MLICRFDNPPAGQLQFRVDYYQVAFFWLGILVMTGPRLAGHPWTPAEVAGLHELIAAHVRVGVIARKLAYSGRGPRPYKLIQEHPARPDVRCTTPFAPFRASRIYQFKRSEPPPGRTRPQGEGEAMKLEPVGTPTRTEADDAKLRSSAVAGPNSREIAMELNRSLYAVRARSEKLGVSLKRVMVRRHLKP
jgi:hypothetical protein